MRLEEQIKPYELSYQPNFKAMSNEALENMVEAGQEVLNIHRILAKTGANVVGELLKGYSGFMEWDHYPKGDVYDRDTHAQFYYHAHVADQRFENEHGHFHTFLRPKGMPEDLRPAMVADATLPENPDDHLSHLIAISMNPAGIPFRLFTVNRWVTGEVWYTAEDVIQMLDLFEIDHTWPSWPVNRWISAMIPLFRPQVLALVAARDRAVAQWAGLEAPAADGPLANPPAPALPADATFEDRQLEVTSYIDISIEAQVQSVAQELLSREG
ncbi:MAG: hypothetical protein AAF530_13665 [Pseudomonadota bacterium]